jgi:predicted Zn finger-like uncharacterized protein
MLIDCKNCNNKFSLEESEHKLEGQKVKCQHCKEEWVYVSKSNYLENRLAELDQDLHRTELKLNNLSTKHVEKVDQLEKNLKIKKEEQSKQKLLEDKIAVYEKRITETEKSNAAQADLEIKITKMENEVDKVTENIFTKNKDIEKKANYLEMKIKSYKDDLDKERQKKIETYNSESEVVNFKSFEQKEKKNKEEPTKEIKKKANFFWPKSK